MRVSIEQRFMAPSKSRQSRSFLFRNASEWMRNLQPIKWGFNWCCRARHGKPVAGVPADAVLLAQADSLRRP